MSGDARAAAPDGSDRSDLSSPAVRPLHSPDLPEDLQPAVERALENIRRTALRYPAGSGMTNCPPSDVLVGRDTAWMAVGLERAAPEFAAEMLDVFRAKQLPSGRIPEVVKGETGEAYDYGLNVSDNTPLWCWAVGRHWLAHGDAAMPGFRDRFAPAMRACGEHLAREMEAGEGLLRTVPVGDGNVFGIAGWRNIVDGRIQAGAVTEVNCESACALRSIGAFTGESRFEKAAEALENRIRQELWGDRDLPLVCVLPDRSLDDQATGDMLFPVLFGIATQEQTTTILDRLSQADFWSPAGLRTVPSSDPAYDPSSAAGLLGGSWPNLTLWYAHAARGAGRTEEWLRALRAVAAPVLRTASDPWPGTNPGEFCEYFHGDDGRGLGMPLSPWTPPTFLWAAL